MKSTDVVREIMKESGITQYELGKKLGYASQAGLAGRLNAPKIGVATLATILSGLGYELIVRKEGERDGDEWKVTE